jgi:hypothetical protein
MAVAVGGAVITPSDHVDTIVDDIDSDATIGTVATGFTVSAQQARVALGGKLVYINLFLTRSGADITATSGNIADTTCFTLDSTYWPTEIANGSYGNGSMDGEFTISTAGVISLRSANANIVSATNIRICATFIKA